MNRFRIALPADWPSVAAMMRAYYAEDGYPFAEVAAHTAFREFLAYDFLGRFWVADVGEVAGYLAVTLGFSFEYGGRDAFIDELYIDEAHRGAGLGREAVAVALDYCRAQDVRAVHLEVEHHRESAYRLYGRMGFELHERRLMTKLL